MGAATKPKPVAQVPAKTAGQPLTSSAPSRTTLAVTPAEAAKEIERHAQTVMTINVKLEKPDILLVEAMDDLDTNALVLNVSKQSIKVEFFKRHACFTHSYECSSSSLLISFCFIPSVN